MFKELKNSRFLKIYTAVFILLVLDAGTSSGQSKEYTLRSGQRISITADGEFIRIGKITREDENTVINPFEQPSNIIELTNEEFQLLLALKDYLEYREYELFRDSIFIENALLDLEAKRKSSDSKNSNHRESKSQLLLSKKMIYEENVKLAHYMRKLNVIKSLTFDERQRLFTDIKNILNIKEQSTLGATIESIDYSDFSIDLRTAESIINHCKYAISESTQQQGRTVTHAWQIFFGFTPENLMSYFRNEEYMVSQVSVSRNKNTYWLHLEFRFNNKDISRSYGSLIKGDFTRITFLHGRKIFLKHPEDIHFRIEEYTGNTIYSVKYLLRRDHLKILKENSIDEIGVMWNSGFESYPVYDIDLLSNQIKCIENAK
jgi:hypothetical protein